MHIVCLQCVYFMKNQLLTDMPISFSRPSFLDLLLGLAYENQNS